MIPNAGLDNIAAYGTAGASDWVRYAAISEDSTAPLATDLNIGTEAMRTENRGGFTDTTTAIRDPGTNRVGVSIERVYVFDITTELNITKYGYVPVSSGGNFSWIDLTRVDPNDPLSAPVTLNLVNGDQLQLWRTVTITVPWSVDLESFVITGTAGNDAEGTHDAYCGFYAVTDSLSGSSSAGSILALITELFWPTGSGRGCVAISAAANAARDARLGTVPVGGAGAGSLSTLAPYSSGTYYRDKLFKFTTAQANITMTGINLASGNSATTGDHGFKIVFSNPSTFVKANTHELTLTFRVSWQEG